MEAKVSIAFLFFILIFTPLFRLVCWLFDL